MTRSEAKKLGLKHYDSDNECPNGHKGKRFVSNYGCLECLLEHSRTYHVKHLDKNRARLKEYAKTHAEDNNRRSLEYAARVRDAGGKLWHRDKKRIKKSLPETCHWCGVKGEPLQIDHIVPLARGGDNSPANLCASCRTCNLSKGAKLPEEWRNDIR